MALGALVLGTWGFLRFHYPPGTPAPRGIGQWLDPVYDALTLFGLNFSLGDTGALPWQLQVARFLAPAATLVTVVVSTSGLVAGAVESWRLLRHARLAIVIGASRKAELVASVIEATGARVHRVNSGDPASLRRAGLKRAAAVYACEDWSLGRGGDENRVTAEWVLARRRALEGKVFAHVSHLGEAWKLRVDSLTGTDSSGIEYFNLDELAARAYLEAEPLAPGPRVQVLIVGASSVAEAILVALARKVRADLGFDARLTVVLVDHFAAQEAKAYQERWPVVREICDIKPVNDALQTYLGSVSTQPAPHRIYVCNNDEVTAFTAAMAVDATWRERPSPVVVLLGQSASVLSFDTRTSVQAAGPMTVYGVESLAAPLVARGAVGLAHDIAKEVHAAYLADQTQRGTQMGSRPAMRPWDELSDDLKHANYAQARDLIQKLRRIGAAVKPRARNHPPFRVTNADVELLAPLEHERWMKERRAEGWRRGDRDDERKRTPYLVGWSQLEDGIKDNDRAVIRSLETVYTAALAEFDLQIVRTDVTSHVAEAG
jgi:hypothetical protein